MVTRRAFHPQKCPDIDVNTARRVHRTMAVVFVLRRACEYAFIRPGREMLWSPLDRETKYKAKNTIDVPVYRGADTVFTKTIASKFFGNSNGV